MEVKYSFDSWNIILYIIFCVLQNKECKKYDIIVCLF